MIKTILVTGSSGTVGTALTLELNRRKYHVIPLDIKPSLWDKGIDRRTVRCDLRKPLGNKLRGRKPDLIIHLAANARVHDSVVNPKLGFDNYVMMYNVLEYARQAGVERVLFSSSREIYGESPGGRRRREDTTDVTQMKSPYTASKFGSEAMIGAYRQCYGIKTVIARLSNVYGRFDVSERVIPLFMYYAMRNRDMAVFGKEKKLDFTFIDECVDGLVRIVERFDRVAGLTFNIATGRGERLVDLAAMIVRNMQAESKIKTGVKRTGEISSFIGDITLARNKLGYRPKVTLETGLVRNIEWYVKAMKERRVYETQRRNLAKRGWA
ncbi:MAG: NAD-dependent epimerase/dehydratase family protein [candidate division Zixibacteria bacterium]|nr:NAD-dependent epimerase/dehydratase family protein [candidate division Zixibacteria bacterium]